MPKTLRTMIKSMTKDEPRQTRNICLSANQSVKSNSRTCTNYCMIHSCMVYRHRLRKRAWMRQFFDTGEHSMCLLTRRWYICPSPKVSGGLRIITRTLSGKPATSVSSSPSTVITSSDDLPMLLPPITFFTSALSQSERQNSKLEC
jgi:hypothetical protein